MITEINIYTNRNYALDGNSFIARGIHINELREKINEIIREINGLDQYDIFEEGEQQWRIGSRNGKYVRDKTLTATGFAGTEGVDWENTLEDL